LQSAPPRFFCKASDIFCNPHAMFVFRAAVRVRPSTLEAECHADFAGYSFELI
jgi:hypothetical protein